MYSVIESLYWVWGWCVGMYRDR